MTGQHVESRFYRQLFKMVRTYDVFVSGDDAAARPQKNYFFYLFSLKTSDVSTVCNGTGTWYLLTLLAVLKILSITYIMPNKYIQEKSNESV